MKDFGSAGMGLYVLEERVDRITPDYELALPTTERRSTWSALTHAIRSGVNRVR